MEDQLSQVINSCALSLGYPSVQLQVISEFVKGRDVFAVLPTGYGKSLCYALLPLVFDALSGSEDSIVIVMTPLLAIIKDQVKLPNDNNYVRHGLR